MRLPATIRRIVLTGFMGAGKSTVGPLLAQRLGWDFLDVDTAIESRAGKTVAEIFAESGESAFRALEAEAIRDHAHLDNLVLALGGGAVENASTRELLAHVDQTCVLFLDAPLDVLVARCLNQTGASARPVLADREKLLSRLNARLPHYRAAHLTVTTAEDSPQKVVTHIVQALAPRCVQGKTAKGVPTR
ncbi:MAG TPA: shikimate kinase [Silvibacterium sp.]|nr:shikimate kinase [Silvibacterium sp.]